MKKILYFLILSLFVISVIVYGDRRPQEDVLSDRRIIKTGKRLEQKYNMSISAVGGATKEGLWLLTVMFDRKGEPMTIEEGRRVIIDCIQEYLKDINNDEELRPYLKVYPFTIDNLHVAIINFAKDGSLVFDPILELITSRQEKIIYRTRDSADKYKYKNTFEETYEEALGILQKEREASASL